MDEYWIKQRLVGKSRPIGGIMTPQAPWNEILTCLVIQIVKFLTWGMISYFPSAFIIYLVLDKNMRETFMSLNDWVGRNDRALCLTFLLSCTEHMAKVSTWEILLSWRELSFWASFSFLPALLMTSARNLPWRLGYVCFSESWLFLIQILSHHNS